MARPIKANTQSSRLKIITLGDTSKQLTLAESGATVIITAAATAARTITLPQLAGVQGTSGAYYRILFGVASDSFDHIIKTAQTTEYIRGTAIFYRTHASSDTGGLNTLEMVAEFSNGTEDTLTLNSGSGGMTIDPSTMVEVTTDGSHWYISDVNIIGESSGLTGPAFS